MPFVKGKSGNVKGRPKGIIDKRMRLNKALMGDADALLKVATELAKAGDGQMLTLLLSRAIAPLKPEGTPVSFALNVNAPLSEQIAQVTAAVASAELTIEQGERVANMIRVLAEARAAEGAGDNANKLIDAFKEISKTLPV
jgi:hypothetical protein